MVIPQIKCQPLATKAEIFLVERSLELLSPHSIESYRLSLHNPRTLLKELRNAIKELNSGDMSNEEYSTLLIEEAIVMFKGTTHLKFGTISEEYFKTALSKKDKNDLMEIFYASSIITLDNKSYPKTLMLKIWESLKTLNQNPNLVPADFEELNDLISFFLIELREIGYSKVYLKRLFTGIFISITAGSFAKRLAIVARLIYRKKENFEVIVGFTIKPSVLRQLQILDPSLKRIETGEITEISGRTNKKISDFFFTNSGNTFYKTELACVDYYSASNQIRKNLHLVLDMLFMVYSNEEFSLNPKCVVIGSEDPTKAGVHNLNYQLDGFFKNDQKQYEEFSRRIKTLREKDISIDCLNRIEAGLRYLRLGSDVKEVENKLINYWIGMEYFFSSNDSKKSKIKRMREYFKRMHGKIYFKRLLLDFHRNVKMYSHHLTIVNFDLNLKYLIDPNNFDLIEQNQTSPLLAFRAYKLKKILFERKSLVADLKRHVQRVEWNLVRIYRQRNSIIHSASGESNILDITSHLRYYLIFSINSAVDYMSNSPFDINEDGVLNLEDYFLVNKTEFDNLIVDSSVDIAKLISIKNPIEFLT